LATASPVNSSRTTSGLVTATSIYSLSPFIVLQFV
jgi:hypothetical protein